LGYCTIVNTDTGEYYSAEGGYGSNVGVKWTRNPYHAAFGDKLLMCKMLRILREAGYKVKLEQ